MCRAGSWGVRDRMSSYATVGAANGLSVTDSDQDLRPIGPIPSGSSAWTFLSNYAHVLVCLARDPEMRLRDVADEVGITERAVQRIVRELEVAGVLKRSRRGRRNYYEIVSNVPLRHALEAHCTVGQLLDILLAHES